MNFKLMTLVSAFAITLGTTSMRASCCDDAKKEGKECSHQCCIDAAKAKKSCEKCNPKKEKKKRKFSDR